MDRNDHSLCQWLFNQKKKQSKKKHDKYYGTLTQKWKVLQNSLRRRYLLTDEVTDSPCLVYSVWNDITLFCYWEEAFDNSAQVHL